MQFSRSLADSGYFAIGHMSSKISGSKYQMLSSDQNGKYMPISQKLPTSGFFSAEEWNFWAQGSTHFPVTPKRNKEKTSM